MNGRRWKENINFLVESGALASILKKIVERFNTNRQDGPSERVFVAAFGKHPGWDDHIDDIGIETDVLVAVKRIIYVQGIGGNIDSGTWDKLQENQQIEDFKHIFLWRMDGNIIVGRMWSSRDGKGRTSYPMVVCAQCCQLPLEWTLENILPRLEKIKEACVGTTSAVDVQTTIENARNELRELAAQQSQPSAKSITVQPDALARLADCPEMGPDHQGLIRILYRIELEITRHHSDTADGKTLRPTLVRVPACPAPLPTGSLLWFSFILKKFGINTPLLILIPLGKSWMDIITGEPTDSQLYCLRASPAAIPLTSSIPYNMDSEFIEKASKLIDDSRSQVSTQNPQETN
jgi:hypothetical protein